MRSLLAAAFLFFVCTRLACAQAMPLGDDTAARVRELMAQIYNLNYDQAAGLARKMIAAAPEDPAGYVFLARTYWSQELGVTRALSLERFASAGFFTDSTRYTVTIDPRLESRFRDATANAIQKGKARLQRNRDDRAARYLLGVAYQNAASFEAALKRRWWAAFRAASKAEKYHRELLNQDPSFVDPLLTVGVSEYVTASLPWKVSWVAVFMGYSGSRQRGREMLETAAAKGSLVADDARTMLALFYTLDKNYQRAYDKLTQLLARYPRNYLVHLDMGGLTSRMGRHDQAVTLYQQILAKLERRIDGYDQLDRPTVLNRLGAAYRAKGDQQMAANWFRRALDDPAAPARTRTITHLELGKTLDLLGRRKEAIDQYRAVASAEDFAGSRLEAEKYLRRPFQLNR